MDLGDAAERSVGGKDSAGERWAEYLSHRDTNRTVAIAPHGGQLEPFTDMQPFHLSTSLPDCSAWAFCGYTEEGSARDIYYTTSTAVMPADYELLPALPHGEFDLAVAFHGYAPDRDHPDTYVGGTLPADERDAVAAAIERESGLDAESARPSDGLRGEYGGIAPDNILNRLSETTIQLEQTLAARESHAAVCKGLVEAMRAIDDE